MNMLHEVISAGIYSILYVSIFFTGEKLHQRFPEKKELSRKFVHFIGGCISASFPYFLQSHWTVLILALSFAGIIFISKRKGALQSVHGVERKSHGGIYFPIAVYLLFLLSIDMPILYIIPILVMTISDTLAALIGGRYGSIRYEVEGDYKSLEGSTVFFFATFLIIHLPLLLLANIGRLESVIIALIISILVTGFEMISLSGSDNLFVPVGTFFILNKMIQHPLHTDIHLLAILLALIAIAFTLNIRFKFLKGNGLVGMILLNYAAWALCAFEWFLVLFLAQLMYYYLLKLFHIKNKEEEIIQHQIKALFYTTSTPIILIFIANVEWIKSLIFIPFIISIASQMALISTFFYKQIFQSDGIMKKVMNKNQLISGLFCVTSTLIFVAAIPIMLLSDFPKAFAFMIIFVCTWASYLINPLIDKIYPIDKTLREFKVRWISCNIGVGLSILLQTFLFLGR